MSNCSFCKQELNQPDIPQSLGCGGDCLKCMSEIVEDPDCILRLEKINKEVKASGNSFDSIRGGKEKSV